METIQVQKQFELRAHEGNRLVFSVFTENNLHGNSVYIQL